MTGYYPEAFFDGRFFFDGSLEGALLRYTGKYWCMEGAVDNIWIYPHLKVASVHHYDGNGWGWQQLIQLVVNLNNFQFPVKSKADNPHHHHR